MIKTILKLAILLVAGVLIYNYFLGSPDEKAASQKVFNEIKDVGSAVTDFVKDEHQRIKDGKYDKVIGKVDDALTNIEAHVKNMDPEAIAEYKELKRESAVLEKEIEQVDEEDTELSKDERKAIEEKLKSLLKRTNEFIREEVRSEEVVE